MGRCGARVFPVFEGGGTHMNISGVAMTKSAPNKDAALKFMEWLSDEAQQIYAETNHEFPVKPGVHGRRWWKAGVSFTPDTLPLAEVAAAPCRPEDHGRDQLRRLNHGNTCANLGIALIFPGCDARQCHRQTAFLLAEQEHAMAPAQDHHRHRPRPG